MFLLIINQKSNKKNEQSLCLYLNCKNCNIEKQEKENEVFRKISFSDNSFGRGPASSSAGLSLINNPTGRLSNEPYKRD